jgi:signal transduction histidine kinase/DNA-binding NarL/FixJ family response regulator
MTYKTNNNKNMLKELFYKDEIITEKTLNRVFILFAMLTFFLIFLESNISKTKVFIIPAIISASVFLIYHVVMFFILLSGIYRPFFKYLSTTYSSLIVTGFFFSYFYLVPAEESLKAPIFMIYVLLIIASGFYQNPVIPIYLSVNLSIQYILIIFFLLKFSKITFLDISHTMDLILFNNIIMYVCGFFISIISIKINKMFKRAINSEIETIIKGQKSKIMSDFFINIAHETKTPLTLIANYLDKFIKSHGNFEEINIVKYNIDKLTSDMINFLDAQKLEKGQLIYDHSLITNFSEILDAKIVIFQKTADNKNIMINKKVQDMIFIKADPYAVERIINNLLLNAVKYNKDNGVIEIHLSASDKEIEFAVRDTGIGISREHLQNIFEPYYQITNEKRNIQGIGMGLHITKNIIESIGGKIEVESEYNEGSVFKVTLIRHRLLDNDKPEVFSDFLLPVNDINIKICKEEYVENKKNVFLVEDNIRMVSYLFENLNGKYNVFYALNGRDALNKIKKIPKPDIIISDIMMDVMSGYEFREETAKNDMYKGIPFLFLSAKSSIEERIKGLEKGAIDFIGKPFIMEELSAKINSILNNHADQKRSTLEEVERSISEAIHNGKRSNPVKHDIQSKTDHYNISDREKEILNHIMQGKEYKEISFEMNISINTVKTHVQNIYSKFDVQNKVELLNLLYNK